MAMRATSATNAATMIKTHFMFAGLLTGGSRPLQRPQLSLPGRVLREIIEEEL